MLDIIVFSFLGIIAGIIAGLLPGLHPNQIYFLSSTLILFLEPKCFVVFLCSLAASNVVFNYLPSLFLSLPELSTVINILPGHRMVLKGEGIKALLASLAAVLLTLIILSISLPFLLFFLPVMQKVVTPIIPFLLIGLMCLMVLLERGCEKKVFAAFLFLLSGAWGLVVLNSKLIASHVSILPALTGLFGLPGLLVSAKTSIPKQTLNEVNVKISVKTLLFGLIAGFLSGVLPGAGESQAGVAVMAFQKAGDEEIVGSLAAINIANLFLSLVMLAATGKVRSGLADALAMLDFKEFLLLGMATLLFSAGISALVCLWFGKGVLFLLENIDYKRLSYTVVIFLLIIVYAFSGFIGSFILFVSTSMGMLPLLLHVKRTCNMGFLMIPVIFYYLGWMSVISTL
jgi:putative membrane protein